MRAVLMIVAGMMLTAELASADELGRFQLNVPCTSHDPSGALLFRAQTRVGVLVITARDGRWYAHVRPHHDDGAVCTILHGDHWEVR